MNSINFYYLITICLFQRTYLIEYWRLEFAGAKATPRRSSVSMCWDSPMARALWRSFALATWLIVERLQAVQVVAPTWGTSSTTRSLRRIPTEKDTEPTGSPSTIWRESRSRTERRSSPTFFNRATKTSNIFQHQCINDHKLKEQIHSF